MYLKNVTELAIKHTQLLDSLSSSSNEEINLDTSDPSKGTSTQPKKSQGLCVSAKKNKQERKKTRFQREKLGCKLGAMRNLV